MQDLACSASLFTSGLDVLFDVRKEMNQVSAKWRSIGVALRLDPNILDGIQTKNSSDPQACLSSVVTEWLKRNYNVERFGEPTWQWLVDAVGDPAGGAHMALAKDIASRHKLKGMSGGYIYKEEYGGCCINLYWNICSLHSNMLQMSKYHLLSHACI